MMCSGWQTNAAEAASPGLIAVGTVLNFARQRGSHDTVRAETPSPFFGSHRARNLCRRSIAAACRALVSRSIAVCSTSAARAWW